jgi:hypothetical protein
MMKKATLIFLILIGSLTIPLTPGLFICGWIKYQGDDLRYYDGNNVLLISSCKIDNGVNFIGSINRVIATKMFNIPIFWYDAVVKYGCSP